MMEWSEMLPEVLDVISLKHITFFEDYLSFAGVCKSWRLAAARTYHNYSNGPPSRFPSLMLSADSDSEDDTESRELFLFSNKSIRNIQLPEADGKACRSSSCGWLLTVGKDFSSQLINPLSREIINLPKVDTFPEAINPLDWKYAISKVVLLFESKLVFVIWGSNKKLGFCHIGDNKWTSVERTNCIRDITFYNGHIYSFDLYDAIEAWNVNGKDPAVRVHVAEIDEDVYNKYVSESYIVGLDDGERKQLLIIIKEGINKIYSFQVLAYDLESRNWSKVEDLGTKTLFVGYNSSFWTEDTTGVIKGNCIYYTETQVEVDECTYGEKGIWRDMVIYHLSDGTIEPYFTAESLSRATPPIWLQSM